MAGVSLDIPIASLLSAAPTDLRNEAPTSMGHAYSFICEEKQPPWPTDSRRKSQSWSKGLPDSLAEICYQTGQLVRALGP